jgi:prepilin-type N-terminal cleavage/methylation domain-containing protein
MDEAMQKGTTKRRTRNEGFTLVEVLLAMMVLVVAILGGMMMVSMGMLRNNSNKIDTTGTNLAQVVLERVASVGPNINTTLSVTDCLPTSALKINTAVGGANLLANGDIDFSQNPAGLNATNYQMNYTVCGSNGTLTIYDVRWNISPVGAGGFGKLVTAAAQEQFVANGKGIAMLRPVTLRTIVGM